jgi:biotin transporter BioY
MTGYLDDLTAFYEIDSSTYLVIAMFCGWAAYLVRTRITNVAWLIFIYPLFCGFALTIYAGAMHLQMFSPKRHSEWIMYSIFAAAIGATCGILIVGTIRRIQDFFITRAHVRRTVRRDEEQEAKGYPAAGA